MTEKETDTCPQCNAEVSPEDEFCFQCGKLLLLDEDLDVLDDEDP